MKCKYVLTIKAEDRPGLLHLVTGIIEKKMIRIQSLNYAPTDIHEVMLITVEIITDENAVVSLVLKLENIIEVCGVEVRTYQEDVCLRAAYYKISRAFLDTSKASLLNKYSAVIVNWYPDAFLAAKYGSNVAILNLYNELDGPHLLGFSQTGLITDSVLIGEDQSSVINRLAA